MSDLHEKRVEAADAVVAELDAAVAAIERVRAVCLRMRKGLGTMTADNRANEPNRYSGFLARQNHQRDPWRGIGAKCLCGKVFDLDADHALHQVDEILRAALVTAQGAADRLAALTTAQEAEGFGGAATVAVSPKGEKGHQEGNVRERLIEALAARHWDRDSGEVEHWVELTDSEKENVIENYIVRDSADAILAAFPELGRDIAGEIEAERADMGEGIGDVYYAQGLARAADIARAGR